MMLELLFLLLPIAVAYGWYMGRREIEQKKQKQQSRLSRTYLAGVNFFLSDQKDKAVDLFLDMLKEENRTLDAHLILGNLFRSRGEVNRAIHIHQSLMNSASLNYDQKLLAMQQLGRDYLAAGFYDRAETMFKQLLNEKDYSINARQQLLLLYQATSDWNNAIEIGKPLINVSKDYYPKIEITHFYCELALQAINNDEPEKALKFLKKAEIITEQNARVSMMFGCLFMDKNNYEKAAFYFERVLEQDKDRVNEILDKLKICYDYLKQAESWVSFLRLCVAEKAGIKAQLYLADVIENTEGIEAAQHFICRQVQSNPCIHLFGKLINIYLKEAEEGHAKESLLMLRNMLYEQIRTKAAYRCRSCGFTLSTLYWHCPSCRAWSSIKPI